MNQSPVHKRGDTIKCHNGHDLCDVAEDVYLGDMDWARKFVNWRCDAPVVGGPRPTCRLCGAGVKLHEPSAHDMPHAMSTTNYRDVVAVALACANYEMSDQELIDRIMSIARRAMSDLYHALTCRNCHWCRCEVGMWAMAMICPHCGRRDRLAFASFRPHEWREAEAYLETRIPGLYVAEMTEHKPANGVVFVDDRLTNGNWYVIGAQEHEIAVPQA